MILLKNVHIEEYKPILLGKLKCKQKKYMSSILKLHCLSIHSVCIKIRCQLLISLGLHRN